MIFRRRIYFIKKGLQSRFIFGFSLTVAIGFLAMWAFAYYTVDKRLSEALYRSHIKIVTTGEVVSDVLFNINLVAVPLLIIATIVVGILITRSVTDSLRDFKEALDGIGKGVFAEKAFAGLPSELSQSYNAMAGNIAKVFASVKTKTDELKERIEEIERSAEERAISRQDVEGISRIISEKRKTIEQEISFFKI